MESLIHSRSATSMLWTGDDTFGPQAGTYFDFTLYFEHSILTILPASIFLFVCPLYMFRFLRRPVSFKHGLLLWTKLLIAALLLGVELANTILTSRHGSSIRNNASIAASVLSSASMLCVISILYAEHRRSLRSSSFLSAFLSITMLFNIVRARSYLSRGRLDVFGALQVAIAILKFVLISLEELSKQSLFQPEHHWTSIGAEMRAGFWNRSLFVWVNKILLVGFKDVINVKDLPEIELEFSAERLCDKFQNKWQAANKSSQYCLLTTSMKALVWPFIAIIVPRLCFTAFTFAQPSLIHTIVRAVDQKELSKNAIGSIIGATGLVYFGLAVTRVCYTHAVYRCLTMNRGMLVSAIFKHTLELDLATAKQSAAVTLMSTDVDSIGAAFTTIHDLWAGIIELAIGVYLLARYVGPAAFLVAVPAVLSTVSSQYLAKKNGPARKAWNQAVQKRVSATNHILGQVKGIKMTGLAPVVAKQLQGCRVAEVEKSKNLRKIIIYIHALAQFFNTNTPVLVIAGGLFWTNASRGLNAADTFATISLTRLVSSPITTLLVGFPQVTSLLACFTRIQNFLLLDSWPGAKNLTFSVPAPLAEHNAHKYDSESGIEMQKSTPSPLKTASVELRPLIELSDVSIAPAIDAEPVLHGVDLKIPASTLTVIVGPVASGKTTLLRAIIGEAYLTGTATGIQQVSTGYCDQVSWLRNISIRDNIIGPAAFDSSWYDKVLNCCLLHEDLRQIPDGDQALAGSGGVSLSGGQRQRVALARAVYGRPYLLVLDDVISALDHHTSHAILERLLGPAGILRTLGTTVVVITHSVQLLAMADHILVLDGKGSVEVRRTEHNANENNTLIEELRKADAIVEGDDSKDDNPISNQDATPKTTPKVTIKVNNAKKVERQRGDLGLYKF